MTEEVYEDSDRIFSDLKSREVGSSDPDGDIWDPTSKKIPRSLPFLALLPPVARFIARRLKRAAFDVLEGRKNLANYWTFFFFFLIDFDISYIHRKANNIVI